MVKTGKISLMRNKVIMFVMIKKNENKENKVAPTNFGKKESSSRPKIITRQFSEDKISGKKMTRRSSLET